jgi:hypothetical protein
VTPSGSAARQHQEENDEDHCKRLEHDAHPHHLVLPPAGNAGSGPLQILLGRATTAPIAARTINIQRKPCIDPV